MKFSCQLDFNCSGKGDDEEEGGADEEDSDADSNIPPSVLMELH